MHTRREERRKKREKEREREGDGEKGTSDREWMKRTDGEESWDEGRIGEEEWKGRKEERSKVRCHVRE